MALLQPDLPKSVVAIGTKQGKRFVTDSTGFAVRMKVNKSDKQIVLPKNFSNTGEIPRYLLVTNRHVFDGRDEVIVKFNDGQQIKLPLKNLEGRNWTNHKDENVDIAVSFIPGEFKPADPAVVSVVDESDFATSKIMEDKGISVGDEVYALGFPLRLAGEERNYPIVRSGVIARFDSEILKKRYYYVDVAIYPGNSGGPVILKPTDFSIIGTSAVNKSYVIGVVSAVEQQPEILYGKRNGKDETRMVLYERANLGVVVPMEYVKEAVDFLKRSVDQRKPGTGKKGSKKKR